MNDYNKNIIYAIYKKESSVENKNKTDDPTLFL